VGPRAGPDGYEKSGPPPTFELRTVQPVESRYIDLKKLEHVSMPLCIIFRGFFCYTKVTCRLKCSPLVHTLKVLLEYRFRVINVQLMFYIKHYSNIK